MVTKMNTLKNFANEFKHLSFSMGFHNNEVEVEEMLFYSSGYDRGGFFVWIDESSNNISIDRGEDISDYSAGLMGSEPSGNPTNFKSTKEAAAFLLTILWKSKLDYITCFGDGSDEVD